MNTLYTMARTLEKAQAWVKKEYSGKLKMSWIENPLAVTPYFISGNRIETVTEREARKAYITKASVDRKAKEAAEKVAHKIWLVEHAPEIKAKKLAVIEAQRAYEALPPSGRSHECYGCEQTFTEDKMTFHEDDLDYYGYTEAWICGNEECIEQFYKDGIQARWDS